MESEKEGNTKKNAPIFKSAYVMTAINNKVPTTVIITKVRGSPSWI